MSKPIPLHEHAKQPPAQQSRLQSLFDDEGLPEIEDGKEIPKTRTSDFWRKYGHLEKMGVGQRIRVDGQKTRWSYTVAQINKEKSKKFIFRNTQDGQFLIRQA